MQSMARGVAAAVALTLAGPAFAQVGGTSGAAKVGGTSGADAQVGGTSGADGDSLDYFAEPTKAPLTYRVDGARSRNQKVVLVSLAGATVLATAVGVYFHMDARDATREVEALSGEHTNRVYTPEVDARRQDAVNSGTAATVFYGLGSALLISTVVAFIVTSPPDEIHEYKSGNDSRISVPYIVPVDGGAMIGKQWTY